MSPVVVEVAEVVAVVELVMVVVVAVVEAVAGALEEARKLQIREQTVSEVPYSP